MRADDREAALSSAPRTRGCSAVSVTVMADALVGPAHAGVFRADGSG